MSARENAGLVSAKPGTAISTNRAVKLPDPNTITSPDP